MIFFKKKKDSSLVAMENKIITAFSSVNGDINKLQNWIMHLHTKSEGLHASHSDHISLTRRDIDKINSWLMHMYSHNQSLQGYIKETTEKVKDLYNKNKEIFERLKEIEEKHRTSRESSGSVRIQSELKDESAGVSIISRGSRFEESIMSRIRPNRKSYIMQEMMKLIEENKYSTKEIEHIIVKEKNLCGRTAFYSYLKELRLKGHISQSELGMKKVLVKSSSTND